MNNYRIFDVNRPLMEASPIVSGKSNADAARKYAASAYPGRKLKASGSNLVQISAQECVIENGKTMLKGWKRQTWFEII